MDINCPTCGEPWDMDHLLNDEVYEWGLPEFAVNAFLQTHRFTSKDDIVRIAAESVGWKFVGYSVLSFVECPACKQKGQANANEKRVLARKQCVEAIVNVLDEDLDGLASALADAGRLS